MGETHGSTFHALKKKLHNSLFTFSFDHISQSMEPNNVESIAGQHRLGSACSCKDNTVQASQKMGGKNDVQACVFSVFRALNILT